MSSVAPIPDVARILVNWELYGRLYQNQLYFYSWQGTITQSRLDNICARVAFSFWFNFLGALGQYTTLRTVEAEDRSPGSSLVSSYTVNAVSPGSIPAAATSIALGFVNWVASPGEVHPSRSFVTGLKQSELVGNFVSSSYADGLRDLWATNNASHAPFGWYHVRVSLFAAGAPRAVGVWDRVNGYAVHSYVVSAQQRRQTTAP